MPRQIVECVPNFSEGRDPLVVNRIEQAIAATPEVAVLGRTMDPDHNRSVITFAGSPRAVGSAAIRAVAQASELIDLNLHTGVHPRMGAADVLPFVPVEGISLAECATLATEIGREIWDSLRIPVFLYEAAAVTSERRRLENIRRGHFKPDFGGPEPHPTAGAIVVGARKFLIAWNVHINTSDIGIARNIARSIRESSGGLPNVKALGLFLASRGVAQISMNLTDYEVTPPHVVFEAIRRECEQYGIEITGTEIIGLIPERVLEMAAEAGLRFENFTSELVVERRLRELLPTGMEPFYQSIADPEQGTGGGSAAASAAAMAAALGSLVRRIMREPSDIFDDHRQFCSEMVERDAHAFAALMRNADPTTQEIVAAADTPLQLAERAHALMLDLQSLAQRTPLKLISDVDTAVALARAAVQGGIATANANVRLLPTGEVRKQLENRAGAVNLG